jgi:putative chitobiose transport system substrate-binding protein
MSLFPARRRIRRRAVALAATFAFTLPLAACVGDGATEGGAGSTDEATLTFWTINLKKNFNGYISGLIDSYEASNEGVEIEWVDVPGEDIATKLLSALAGGEAPDVVNIDSNNLGPFETQLADLNQYFDDSDLVDYQPGLLDSLRDGERLNAIPWYNGGAPVGIYDMTVMERVGFDPDSPPKDYEEILDLAQRVRDRTGVNGTNVIPSYVSGQWSVLAYEGIPLLNDDKSSAAFNTPEAAAVLDRFKEAYDGEAIAPGAISEDVRALPQSLENGGIAFLADAFPFALTALEANAPSVYQNVEVTKGPTTPEGKYLLLGQQTFAVPAASQNQAAASEFIKFLTNGENQLEFCKLVPIYPSTISTTEDPFFTEIDDSTAVGRARRIIVEELPNLVDGQLGTGKDAELADAMSEHVRAFLRGSGSAEEALSAAEAAWNEILAEQ